jgi:hypothetical protein
MNLIMTPETKYHANTSNGPSYPTNSANFLEKRTMSNIGFVKFKYKDARACDHLSKSCVSL